MFQLSANNMDPLVLLLLVMVTLVAFCAIVAFLIESVTKIIRTIVHAVVRVKVAKYRAMGRNSINH